MTRLLWSIAIAIAIVAPSCKALADERKPLTDEMSRDDLAKYARSIGPHAKAFPYNFIFPTDVRETTVFGIDVSHYQGTVNWTQVAKQNISFVYIKATQGSQYFDNTFATNWQGVEDLNAVPLTLHRGAYHFMTAKDPPELQADNFIATVGKLNAGDLPPCLDVEWDFQVSHGKPIVDANGRPIDQWADLSPAEITARLTTWLDRVAKSTGKTPIIYTNASWWSHRVGSDASLHGYSLWIADYASKSLGKESPVVPGGFSWSFWQLTDKGKLKWGGIEKTVDTTIYNGSSEDLKSEFRLIGTPQH